MDRPTLKYLMILMLFGTLYQGCGTAETSGLKTTSDKLKEYAYDVRGTIELPLAEEAYQIAYLFDQASVALDHPNNESFASDFKRITESEDEFVSAFEEAHQATLPLRFDNQGFDNQRLNKSALEYWVSRQLKFTVNEAGLQRISLTLKTVTDIQVLPATDENRLVLSYDAHVLGTVDMSSSSSSAFKQLESGESLTIPINPVSSYFSSMGPDFSGFAAEAQAKIQSKKLSDVLQDDRLTKLLGRTKTPDAPSPCYNPDGDHVAPFNFFYYFSHPLEGCTESLVTTPLVIEAVQSIEAPTSYPEFHRLIEDGKVDIFVYFNEVGGEEIGASAKFIKRLEKRGYSQVSKDESENSEKDVFEFQRDFDGIQVSVGISVGSGGRGAFREAIKTHEIVVYDGHAGYGSNIDENFTSQDAIPENKYQIFFLNGCATYRYGMSQILSAKAFKDFDVFNHNVDLITTFDDVRGHNQNDVIIEKIEAAIPYLQSNEWSESTKIDFTSQFSWLAIVTDINKASDWLSKDNGIFMVNGEIGNDYLPGKTAYSGHPELSEEDLLGLIEDRSVRDEVRSIALKSYIQILTAKDEMKSVGQIIEATHELCTELGNASHSIGEDLFHLPSCHIQSIDLPRDLPYKGRMVNHGTDVEIAENGAVERVLYRNVEKIAGFEVDTKTVYYYPNGNLDYFTLKSDSVDSKTGMKLEAGSSVQFSESGDIRRATLAAPHTIGEFTYTKKISFHGNGQVADGTAVFQQKINGFQANGMAGVGFRENGLVHRLEGELSRIDDEWNFDGYGYIDFNKDGQIEYVYAYKDLSIRDPQEQPSFSYRGNRYMTLTIRPDGRRASGNIFEKVELSSLQCGFFEGLTNNVHWGKNDEVIGCNFASGSLVDGVELEYDDLVIRFADGRMLSSETHHDRFHEEYQKFLHQNELGFMAKSEIVGD